MIERHWTAIAKPAEADRYIEHLATETFPQLEELDGFLAATILSRPVAKGTEFLVVTVWASLDSIRQFSGEPVETAVVPDKVQAMMVEFDREARHYQQKLRNNRVSHPAPGY